MVLRFGAPESATAEDVANSMSCGRAVVDAVLGALGRLDGLREARPGEFTRRAFENGRIDLTEVEGLADLLEAETESQHKTAIRLADGGLRRQVEEWSERVVRLSAQAERAIDFADEGPEEAGGATAEACREMAELEHGSRNSGPTLKDGIGHAAGPQADSQPYQRGSDEDR